jgi:hypothetical protein
MMTIKDWRGHNLYLRFKVEEVPLMKWYLLGYDKELMKA